MTVNHERRIIQLEGGSPLYRKDPGYRDLVDRYGVELAQFIKDATVAELEWLLDQSGPLETSH